MAYSLTVTDDEERNRLEWDLSTVLQAADETVNNTFQLHNQAWEYKTCFNRGFLDITVICKSPFNEIWDDIQVGIINDSGENIAVSVATNSIFKDCYLAYGLIKCSEIDSIQKSNKKLRLFIEMTRKVGNGKRIDSDSTDECDKTVITEVHDFPKESIHLPGITVHPEIQVSVSPLSQHPEIDFMPQYRMVVVQIYANGRSEENKGYVSIEFISFHTLGGCITISVIDSSNKQRFMQTFLFDMSEENNSFLIEKYVSRSRLLSDPDEFLPNGILTLKIQVQVRNKSTCRNFHPCSSEFQQNCKLFDSSYHVDAGSRSLKLRADSALAERLLQESEVFKEMFELLNSEDRTETITFTIDESIPLDAMIPLLMGKHICLFRSIQDMFDVYIFSEKYNIKSVMETCVCFWKLYALVHSVKKLFECVNEYESDHLKEILENKITLISETNLDEELVKTAVDVTLKKPVYNRLWTYIYTDEPSTFFCNFHKFVDKNSD